MVPTTYKCQNPGESVIRILNQRIQTRLEHRCSSPRKPPHHLVYKLVLTNMLALQYEALYSVLLCVLVCLEITL